MGNNDFVILYGIKFYRQKNGYYYTSDKGFLHRYIWEKQNGAIPDGYVIHHKDHDPGNNEIGNLECMPRGDHQSMHSKEREEELREHCYNVALPAAEAWAKSAEGRESSRKAMKANWEKRAPKKCEYCGKTFMAATFRWEEHRYCSHSCYAKARYAAGIEPMETRVCEVCGKEFTVRRRSSKKTCSPECRSLLMSRKMTGKPKHRKKKK